MARHVKVPLDPILLARARAMRHERIPAERLVWQCVRNRQLGGWKFRRQAPIGCFVADFYCHELKLIVELDGDSHVGQADADRVRTSILERHGCTVIRFLNVDVFDHLDAVLKAIYAECERIIDGSTPPHPGPLPIPGVPGEREDGARHG
jgi:very-short-patch-repair endonuclease